MVANLKRKVGYGGELAPPPYIDPSIMPPPPQFTVDELGLGGGGLPGDRGVFNPVDLPLWLQEQSLTDLGLPANGSDGIFLRVGHSNGWTGDFPPMPEAW